MGLLLFKVLNIHFKPNYINSIIDDKHKFIKLELKIKLGQIVWLDNYNIFSISLEELYFNFQVKGKFSKYKFEYNRYEMFYNKELYQEFLMYAQQDSLAL